MKKTLFLSIFCIYSALLYSQEKFTVNIGPDFRITPIELKPNWKSDITRPVTNTDAHLSGSALTYFLNYNPATINWRFSLGQSFRYDLLYYSDSYNFEENHSNDPIKTLIVDYHLKAEKYFELKSETELSVQLGFSLMDSSTHFAYTRLTGDTVIPAYGQDGSYDFRAYSLAFGISGNKLGLKIGGYFVEKHQFESMNEENPFILPYIQLQYVIIRLNNK